MPPPPPPLPLVPALHSLLYAVTLFPTKQDIAPFEDPKVELEQYPTGAHLASRLLYTVRPAVVLSSSAALHCMLRCVASEAICRGRLLGLIFDVA